MGMAGIRASDKKQHSLFSLSPSLVGRNMEMEVHTTALNQKRLSPSFHTDAASSHCAQKVSTTEADASLMPVKRPRLYFQGITIRIKI